jgi:hypothetical protein
MRFAPAAVVVLVLATVGCAGSNTGVPGFSDGHDSPADSYNSATAVAEPSTTPTASSTPTVVPGMTETVECATGSVVLNVPDASFAVAGDCDSVIVEGNDITVATQNVVTLEIRGTGNAVSAASIADVSVSGQGNTVTGDPIGTIEISGDGNGISSATTVGSGTVSGDDNSIVGPGGIGTFVDNGSNNLFE